jgi:hypothetical protein
VYKVRFIVCSTLRFCQIPERFDFQWLPGLIFLEHDSDIYTDRMAETDIGKHVFDMVGRDLTVPIYTDKQGNALLDGEGNPILAIRHLRTKRWTNIPKGAPVQTNGGPYI